MSPLSYDQNPVGSIPTRRLRAVNASLASIRAGLKPVIQGTDHSGREYFRFPNGQVRRQERRNRRIDTIILFASVDA